MKRYQKNNRFAREKDQIAFQNRLAKYCQYTYDAANHKYKIHKVYDTPLTKTDITVHQGIYEYLIPALIHNLLDSGEGRQSLFSLRDFIQITNLANQNYWFIQANQDAVSADLEIKQSTTYEFIHNTNDRANHYIRYALEYLRKQMCVEFEEILIVENIQYKTTSEGATIFAKDQSSTTRHIATPEEKRLYAELKERAIQEAEIKSSKQLWTGEAAHKYYQVLTQLLKDNNISFVIKGFNLIRISADKCKAILATYNTTADESMQEVGNNFKTIIDSNAAKRSKDRYNPEEYLNHFMLLSSISLLYNAEDIRPQIPSAFKKRKQKTTTIEL